MGEIFPQDSTTQFDWQNNATSCFRPTTNWTIPIVCYGNESPRYERIVNSSGGIETLGSCCPLATNGSTLFNYRKGCGISCHTHNVTLAKNWDTCVNNGFSAENNTLLARCEWVNFTLLHEKTSRADRRASKGAMVLIAGLLVTGVLGSAGI
ncbi:hypothetical protein B0J14DRAFT_574880 [Halenospora varia]|nr:hypothetical protein B0J14DRAFT_574880 [Halenospora varia]